MDAIRRPTEKNIAWTPPRTPKMDRFAIPFFCTPLLFAPNGQANWRKNKNCEIMVFV